MKEDLCIVSREYLYFLGNRLINGVASVDSKNSVVPPASNLENHYSVRYFLFREMVNYIGARIDYNEWILMLVSVSLLCDHAYHDLFAPEE